MLNFKSYNMAKLKLNEIEVIKSKNASGTWLTKIDSLKTVPHLKYKKHFKRKQKHLFLFCHIWQHVGLNDTRFYFQVKVISTNSMNCNNVNITISKSVDVPKKFNIHWTDIQLKQRNEFCFHVLVLALLKQSLNWPSC